jgi:hypothetical protein
VSSLRCDYAVAIEQNAHRQTNSRSHVARCFGRPSEEVDEEIPF